MTVVLNTYNKDPEAILDYTFDWSLWVAAGETILTATVTAPSGITIVSTTHTSTTVTAWVSGGTINSNYRVECKITTSAGRTDVRGIYIRITDR